MMVCYEGMLRRGMNCTPWIAPPHRQTWGILARAMAVLAGAYALVLPVRLAYRYAVNIGVCLNYNAR